MLALFTFLLTQLHSRCGRMHPSAARLIHNLPFPSWYSSTCSLGCTKDMVEECRLLAYIFIYINMKQTCGNPIPHQALMPIQSIISNTRIQFIVRPLFNDNRETAGRLPTARNVNKSRCVRVARESGLHRLSLSLWNGQLESRGSMLRTQWPCFCVRMILIRL